MRPTVRRVTGIATHPSSAIRTASIPARPNRTMCVGFECKSMQKATPKAMQKAMLKAMLKGKAKSKAKKRFENAKYRQFSLSHSVNLFNTHTVCDLKFTQLNSDL